MIEKMMMKERLHTEVEAVERGAPADFSAALTSESMPQVSAQYIVESYLSITTFRTDVVNLSFAWNEFYSCSTEFV